MGSAPEAPVSLATSEQGGVIARGPAYTTAGKLVATALMVGLCLMGWQAMSPQWRVHIDVKDALVVAMVLGLFVWTWLFIVLCQVELTATGIRQGWGYWKRAQMSQVTQVKYVQIPGLSWLFAPRLIVRSVGGVMPLVFQLADPTVRREVIAVFGPDPQSKT